VIIIIVDVAAVLLGAYFLNRQHKRRSVIGSYSRFDLPSIVVMCGIISASFFAITARLRQQTLLRYTLDEFGNTIYGLGFYLLLLFWLRTLSIFLRTTSFALARVAIVTCLLITLTNFSLGLAWNFTWPSPALLWIRTCVRLLTPAAQILAAVTWAVYGVLFLLRRRTHDIPGAIARCLSAISRILLVGFFTYLGYSITSIVGGQVSVIAQVAPVTVVYVLVAIFSAARAAAMVALTVVPVWDTEELRVRTEGVAPLMSNSRNNSVTHTLPLVDPNASLFSRFLRRARPNQGGGGLLFPSRLWLGPSTGDLTMSIPSTQSRNASTTQVATALAVAQHRQRNAEVEMEEEGEDGYTGNGLAAAGSLVGGSGWGAAALNVNGEHVTGTEVVLASSPVGTQSVHHLGTLNAMTPSGLQSLRTASVTHASSGEFSQQHQYQQPTLPSPEATAGRFHSYSAYATQHQAGSAMGDPSPSST